MNKVLISCPPMIKQKESFKDAFSKLGIEPTWANVVQQYTEAELIKILPEFDGWIIGDDPCTRDVLLAGKKGKLRALVKWGIGVDNVDFATCSELGIPVENTPNMFGDEVADLAMAYITNLSRFVIDVHVGVKKKDWLKPIGSSLRGKNVGIIGLGDIGMNIVERVVAAKMNVFAYDPFYKVSENVNNFELLIWPKKIEELDYLVIACSLTKENKHMINQEIISKLKKGVKFVNVSRGPLIDERALSEGLESGIISGAALDVYENEPLSENSPLRAFEQIIFGTHNGSNTFEAVQRTSHLAISKISSFLAISNSI
jgi:D-3-phosphoglycerate dehydrogenase